MDTERGSVLRGRTGWRVLPAAVACLLVLGLATSCSSGNEGRAQEPARTVQPVTDTPPPTPTEPPMPTYPPAGKVQTPAGAEAAFRHYVDSYSWAFAHADPQPLINLTVPGCQFCKSVRDSLDDMRSRGERARGAGLVLHSVLATPGNVPTEVLLAVNMSQQSGVVIDADGTPVRSSSPDKPTLVNVLMVWTQDRWLVGEAAW